MMHELSFKLSENRKLVTDLPAFIVGIINVTPDSFCPVGKCTPENVAQTALRLVQEGASMLDVGAESTRPGYVPVPAEEELSRLIPAVKAIRSVTDCPLSIDTTKALVMEAALKEGADIANDISALETDGKMINVCADAGIPVILMHNHDIMGSHVDDTVSLTAGYLAERVVFAIKNGVNPEKMILDPGIGFGKTFEQNLCLIKNPGKLRERVLELAGLKGEKLLPVMMALSRKSCIGKITGRETEQRLAGTLAANQIAVQEGATFLRVHDVAATRDMLATVNALN